MIYNIHYKKNKLLNKISEEQKMAFMYRYVSLIITSLFFFASPIEQPIYRRLFIIACIGAASIILNYLYIRENGNARIIRFLIAIETISNCVMLIPSGGLNSPYVWYALNTIFIAAVMLDRKYSLLSLLTFLISSTWVSYLVFDDQHENFAFLMKQQTNLVISYILITTAVWMLLRYVREIERERIKLLKVNKQLVLANHQVKESVNHIMELYQAVHLFSNLKNKQELIELILRHTKRITSSHNILFFSSESNEIIASLDDAEFGKADYLMKKRLLDLWDNIIKKNQVVQLCIEDKCFLATAVKSSYMTYGILVVEIKCKEEGFDQVESVDQIKFLAELSSIVLEKFELERVNNKLLIAEEQNRIATEIHDSVLQRLFSTSFGIYGLMKRLNKVSIQDADEDLNLIRESIDQAMKELRAAIYGLSWKKNGTDTFVADLMKYIDTIKRMSNVDININIIGESELTLSKSKKAIYRIICEGIGNAVKHGKAKHIEIVLNIKVETIQLRIVDDGEGFDFDTVFKTKQGGLGIYNIHSLVTSMKGVVNYQSKIGKGTSIELSIPNCTSEIRGDKVV